MKKTRRLFNAGICLTAFVLTFTFPSGTGLTAEQDGSPLIVSYDNWPPFTDENDPNLGACFAIVNAALQPSGYRIQPKLIPFKRADMYLRKGIHVDASPYYWFTEQRAGYLEYSKPMLYNRVHFFVRPDSRITFNTLEDMKGYRIGIIRGYHNGEAFDNATYLDKFVCNESEQAIRMLVKGRLDAAVIDTVVAETIMAKLNLANPMKALPKPLFSAGLHFVVSKKHPECKRIINAFNTGLERLKTSGEYQKIMDAYGISRNSRPAAAR